VSAAGRRQGECNVCIAFAEGVESGHQLAAAPVALNGKNEDGTQVIGNHKREEQLRSSSRQRQQQ
jgi:hypothetical protein